MWRARRSFRFVYAVTVSPVPLSGHVLMKSGCRKYFSGWYFRARADFLLPLRLRKSLENQFLINKTKNEDEILKLVCHCGNAFLVCRLCAGGRTGSTGRAGDHDRFHGRERWRIFRRGYFQMAFPTSGCDDMGAIRLGCSGSRRRYDVQLVLRYRGSFVEGRKPGARDDLGRGRT